MGLAEPRYTRLVPCRDCLVPCPDAQRCEPARQPLRRYTGLRFTSDGFDCALPISIDSHSMCSYGCQYCFADNLIEHQKARTREIGQTDLGHIERIFAGEGGGFGELVRRALRYDRPNAAGYPCPVQLGALTDPCDHIELQQGWLLKYIELAKKYRQPTRISTKGTVFQIKEYLDAVAEAPELFWVAFSIITPDDEVIEKTDRRAPNATMRLKTMEMLSSVGVKTSLRFRPIFPGISDATKNYPEAYRVLIEKAAEAGAGAISYEVGFVPGTMPKSVRHRWQLLSEVAGVPFEKLYRSFGPTQACMRPPVAWTENIMHAIRYEAHKHDMTVGVSDPVWKQLTDVGCCCGISPDDPVFGNWQVESATNQLLIAKNTGKLIGPDDIIPSWAYDVRISYLANIGPGPKFYYAKRHRMWSDRLRDTWNDLEAQRGPLNYFQGALMPVTRDKDGNVLFRYEGLKREYPQDPLYWSVTPEPRRKADETEQGPDD